MITSNKINDCQLSCFSCNTRGLNISTHASITKCTVFTSYHINTIKRKKCTKIQNSFEDIAEHLFYHSKSTFVTEVNFSSQFLK